jgi:protein TonB
MDEMRSPFRIGGPTAASLLVNGLLIAALLNLGVGRQQRHVEAPSLTVMSLALLKGAEDGDEEAKNATQSRPSPPSETSSPTPDQPPAIASPAPVAIALAPSLLAAAPPPAASSPALSAAAAAPTARAAAAVLSTAQQPPAPAARRGAAEGLDADAPAGTSRAYAARVRSWLYAHKVYPKKAKMRREEGIVRVRFIIDRTGTLIEGHVIGSSGRASLDEEADAMMQRASPYPKAPRDVPGDRIEFTAPIEFTLPV